jgi:hypothetical protein
MKQDSGTSIDDRYIGPYRCPDYVVHLHNLGPTIQFLCLFISAKNGIDSCSADGALTFECWFTILHSDFLRIFHLSLCFAFDTIILIGHGEVASLHCSKTLKNTYHPIFGMYGTRKVHFVSLFLQLLLHLLSQTEIRKQCE